MDIYRENILDHFNNPRNFGELENADATHEKDNPFCGDRIKIQLKIENCPPEADQPLADKLKIVRFSGEGCAISIASASMLTEKAKGAKIKDLRKLGKNDILKMLGIHLSPTRLKCVLLPLEALQKAILKLKTKNQK